MLTWNIFAVITVSIYTLKVESRELMLPFKILRQALNDSNQSENPNITRNLNISRKTLLYDTFRYKDHIKFRQNSDIPEDPNRLPAAPIQDPNDPEQTIIPFPPDPEELNLKPGDLPSFNNNTSSIEDNYHFTSPKFVVTEEATLPTMTMPEDDVDIFAFPEIYKDTEDYKGRPVPDDLKALFYNKSLFEDDLHECMQEITYCLYIQKDYPLCAVSKSGEIRKFNSICEFQYSNCKDGKNSWREIDDGDQCTVYEADKDEAVLDLNKEKISNGEAVVVEVPLDKLPKEPMGPPPPDYKEVIVVQSRNDSENTDNSGRYHE